MIILLTGKSGIGKSTLIEKLIRSYSEPADWVVVAPISRADGSRAGFKVTDPEGKSPHMPLIT